MYNGALDVGFECPKEGNMNKRPEITSRTRKRLADAFWQLYAEKNVNEIRINEITDLAGYHRGTFYEYYTDIYDLLSQEEEALVEKLRQSKDLMDSGGKPFFSEIIGFYRDNGSRVSLLIRHGNMSFTGQLKEALYPMFLEEYGLKECGKSSVIFEFGINGILMSLDYWYNHQDEIALPEYLTTLEQMIKNGILPMLQDPSACKTS